MARKIAGGFAKQAAFVLALACLFMPVMPAPRPEDAAAATLSYVPLALQKGEKVRILAIGSSSTLRYGASSKDMSNPSQLESILEHALKGVDVVILNRGVSGEVAEDTAERIKSEVALRNPDLVLWQLGTNDALARIPSREFEATVRSTIRWPKTVRLARDANYVA